VKYPLLRQFVALIEKDELEYRHEHNNLEHAALVALVDLLQLIEREMPAKAEALLRGHLENAGATQRH